ncbi:MAG: C4-dicarboxylate TRAP transporter substrate-binding protein [Planctomycetes bacterium]|nr:C4-dicarboxylate TRAP transporter substrate-binding protein [Planctomycetota bacterium]
MTRSGFWALILFLFVFGLTATAQSGEAKYILKFGHVHTEQEPYGLAWQEWADNVFKRTNGEVRIDVYANAQLGVEEDLIEQMRLGGPIGTGSDTARMGNYVKEWQVLTMPYCVETLEEIVQLRELDLVKNWAKRMEDEFGIHVVSFNWVQGYRNMITNVPIRTPGDLKPLRIRAAPAPAWQEMVRALGAIPVSVPYGEIYSAVQTRVVDGAENNFVASYYASMFEVCRFISETQHLLQINSTLIGAEWFKQLPAEYQKIIDEECDKVGLKVSNELLFQLAPEFKQRYKDRGVTIIEQKDMDMDAFRKAAASAYEVLGLADVRANLYKEMGKKM